MYGCYLSQCTITERRMDVICRNAPLQRDVWMLSVAMHHYRETYGCYLSQCTITERRMDVICRNAPLQRDERGRDIGMLPVAMQKEESEEENEKKTAVSYGCHLWQCSRWIIIIILVMSTIKAHSAACTIPQVQKKSA